ncbi:hypothetical protein ScPMuIL_002218 [Solemya velum]
MTVPIVKQSSIGSSLSTTAAIGGWSFYRTFRSLFIIPTVHADGPTATDRIAENVEKHSQSNHARVISEVEVQQFLARETGWDRLRMMYTPDATGKYSTDVQFMSSITLQAAGMTFLLTSVISGRHAKEEFIQGSKATVFPTKFQAMRRLTDTIYMRSLKDGTKWGLKIGLFSTSVLLVSQSIAAYRNRSSVFEYIIAGMVSGSLFKMSLGLKGMVGGGFFGGIAGLVGGLIIYGTMYLSNETQEQRHYWWIQRLLEQDREMVGKSRSPDAIISTYPTVINQKAESVLRKVPE